MDDLVFNVLKEMFLGIFYLCTAVALVVISPVVIVGEMLFRAWKNKEY